MAEGFEIKVPISIKGGKREGRDIGKEIADQIKKTLGSIGIGGKTAGKGGGGGMLSAGIGKMTGYLALIALVISSLDFILKPVMSMLKVILILLFLFLVPILKPVLQLLAIMAKTLAPIMKKVSSVVDTLMSKTIMPFMLESAEKLSTFYVQFVTFFLDLIQIFLENLPSISDALRWFGEKGSVLFGVILDVLIWAGDFLSSKWKDIKGLLIWAGDFLMPVWEKIKGILTNAGDSILPKLTDVTIKLANILIDLYNAISKAVERMTFGLFGGDTLEKLQKPDLDVHEPPLTDFISRPGQAPVSFSPRDTIIGMKDASKLGGSITININNPIVRQTSDIKSLANEVSRVLQRQINNRMSPGI